jgi:hypothetical protein
MAISISEIMKYQRNNGEINNEMVMKNVINENVINEISMK